MDTIPKYTTKPESNECALQKKRIRERQQMRMNEQHKRRIQQIHKRRKLQQKHEYLNKIRKIDHQFYQSIYDDLLNSEYISMFMFVILSFHIYQMKCQNM